MHIIYRNMVYPKMIKLKASAQIMSPFDDIFILFENTKIIKLDRGFCSGLKSHESKGKWLINKK